MKLPNALKEAALADSQARADTVEYLEWKNPDWWVRSTCDGQKEGLNSRERFDLAKKRMAAVKESLGKPPGN